MNTPHVVGHRPENAPDTVVLLARPEPTRLSLHDTAVVVIDTHNA